MKKMITQNGISNIDAAIICASVDTIVMTSALLVFGLMPTKLGTF